MLVRTRTEGSEPLTPPPELLRPPSAPPARRATVGAFVLIVGVALVFTPFTSAPFVDAKLLLACSGALLLAPVAMRADRVLRRAVLAWVAAAAVATVAGVDALASLLGGEKDGVGLVLVAVAGTALLAGVALPRAETAVIPRLVLVAAAIASGVALAGRWVGLATPGGTLDLAGGTLGHPAFLGAFLGTALVVLAGTGLRNSRNEVVLAALLASGLSVTANRGGLLGAVFGLAVVTVIDREGRRRVARVAVVLALVSIAWAGIDAAVSPADGVSSARRFGQITEGSARDRLTVWEVGARAGTRRPFTGWGPANGWGALLSTVDAEEMRQIGRGWSHAHNLLVDAFLTTGTLGLATLLGLAIVVVRRARRVPPARAWAAGAALALLLPHLLQPMNVVLTPLLFLIVGLVIGGGSREAPPRMRTSVVVSSVLLVAMALAGARLVASSLESHARTYASQPAAELALRLEPRRSSALGWLAQQRALDRRADARALAERTVASRPWDAGVRFYAADALMVLDDLQGAKAWMHEHLERFPFDPVAMNKLAAIAILEGDLGEARRWAERATTLDPSSPALSWLRSGRPI